MSSPGRRLACLMLAGLVDSLCLSFAWTALTLQVVSSYGLGAAGVTSAAMLVGVALSAPVAARLAEWLDGRRLLRGAASVEAVLRVGVFVLLVAHAPVVLLAACVCAMNVTAWTGYAGMRAEVAAVSPGGSALTWYGTGVAAIEAVGAAVAALLPPIGEGGPTRLVVVVAVVYVLGLLPTVVVAGGSPIGRVTPVRGTASGTPVRRTAVGTALRSGGGTAGRRTRLSPPMVAGATLMFAASAPTLLSVGLAAQLHGRTSVALAAVAFTAGSLASPAVAWLVQRRRSNGPTVWILCGFGMVVGWVAAPVSVAFLLLAQVASGLCMTALEGLLDTSTAERAGAGVTGALARATAGRALGSAGAAAIAPSVVAVVGLAPTAAVLSGLLLLAALSTRRLSALHPRTTREVPRVVSGFTT